VLERADIARLIPHAGAMVLIDRVVSVDEKHILCTTMSHRRPDNPLKVGGRLPAICGAEYGAQAAAVHGPAAFGGKQRPGQVVLLRDIVWSVADLGAIAGPLTVHAECLHKDSRSLAYAFRLEDAGRELMRGECGIILSGD
jgi:predicted hotdog family 3-hydroxylacyl-ACP dehydratase